VAELTRAVGAISSADYEMLKRKAVEAREFSEQCRQRPAGTRPETLLL